MRIISKFNNYYDSALAYGMDPNLEYRRETTVAESPESWDAYLRALVEFDEPFFSDPCVTYSVGPALVVIGNRAFRIWARDDSEFDAKTLGTNTKDCLMVDDRTVAELLVREAESSFGIHNLPEAKRQLPDLLARMSEPISVPENWLLEVGVPCIVVPTISSYRKTSHPIVLNPRLATLGIDKRLDPFSCFQEIAMFLGQKLAVEDRASRTVGDDRVIAASKGFDDQSFRTAAPGKKKENRKANKARKKGNE